MSTRPTKGNARGEKGRRRKATKRAAFPVRPRSHELETESVNFFKSYVPPGWTVREDKADYGIDLYVSIFENGQARGRELLVQLKSSAKRAGDEHEIIRLEVSTYNFLQEKLQVVMLAKYVEEDHEAYWEMLSAARAPRAGQRTISVRASKANKISTIDWNAIAERVRSVHDPKRAVTRPAR